MPKWTVEITVENAIEINSQWMTYTCHNLSIFFYKNSNPQRVLAAAGTVKPSQFPRKVQPFSPKSSKSILISWISLPFSCSTSSLSSPSSMRSPEVSLPSHLMASVSFSFLFFGFDLGLVFSNLFVFFLWKWFFFWPEFDFFWWFCCLISVWFVLGLVIVIITLFGWQLWILSMLSFLMLTLKVKVHVLFGINLRVVRFRVDYCELLGLVSRLCFDAKIEV